MADVEQDGMLAREFRRMDRLPLGPRMTLWDNHLERLFIQEFGDDPRRSKGQGNDCGIDAARLECAL